MNVWKWVLFGVLAGTALVAGREVYLALGPRRRKRRSLFAMAQERARLTGKRLVVVGDPDGTFVNSMLGRDYECGDLCIDLMGCQQCPAFIAGRLDQVLPHLADDSAVIFISGALEGDVGDISTVLLGLDRVSGGDLFIAYTEPTAVAAWLTASGRRRILHAPPDTTYFDYKPLPWHPEAVPASQYRIALPNTSRRDVNTIPAHASVVDERRVIDIPLQG